MQRKPIDVGNGIVCAAFTADGRWLSVGRTHPTLGVVEVVGSPRFPAGYDGNGREVRAHRLRLTEPASAVVWLDGLVSAPGGGAAWSVSGPGWVAEVDAWAVPGRASIVQRYRIRDARDGHATVVFTGRLDRPAYAEITPVGPLPVELPASVVRASGHLLEVSLPGCSAMASIVVAARSADLGRWSMLGNRAHLDVRWGRATQVEFRVIVTLDGHADELAEYAEPEPPRGLPAETGVMAQIARGSERYTLECTALRVDANRYCILTDHRLLPLSWTRDAYYQAALLLAGDDPAGYHTVRRHLAWLWGPGRDVTGVWQRSHYANGAVKDRAYQADQQLYPLLELADYRRVSGRWPDVPKAAHSRSVAWGRLVRRVLFGLPRDDRGLLPGEENPADDPTSLPYLLSNQLLLAYTLRRLSEYDEELGLTDLRLADDADRLLTATRRAFACTGPCGSQWAYETDGAGRQRLYHDANDVPTALAPVWGLCRPDDPAWRNLMRFAWSEDNPGYVAGRYGGLGSRHTPGAWPLGDAQEWAVAMLTHDRARLTRVEDKLRLVASDDGMLPETYDPEDGSWLARHWFAWPGSLVGLLGRTFTDQRGPWAVRPGG